jgi:hypothetical protein
MTRWFTTGRVPLARRAVAEVETAPPTCLMADIASSGYNSASTKPGDATSPRAGAADRAERTGLMAASEPDPTVMTQFCHEVVPSMLTSGCGVNAPLAAAIGADVLSRARSFAALADPVRDVLMTPFIEEVFDHEPPGATLEMKAAVTVVVRNSLLEEAHTNGPLEAGGIQAITTAATAPLSHLLAAGRRGRVRVDGDNLFAGLLQAYPRAWRA